MPSPLVFAGIMQPSLNIIVWSPKVCCYNGSRRPRSAQVQVDSSRLLDDLYWVMSYSRWKDERFWPAFRDGLPQQHPSLTEEGLLKAREFNFRRYHYQGLGCFAPDSAYARGLADLQVLARRVPQSGYLRGARPCSADAAIYGFIANILFYPIETPLKQFVEAQEDLVWHCREIHAVIA